MTSTTEVPIDTELARRLYSTMTLAQAVDARLRKGIGRGEFFAVIWPSRGQEAVAAGVGAALRRDDRLVTTYRGIHDLVGKGVPLTEILGEILGKSIGASKGKGGTMHITAPEQGVALTTGIVGAGVPVAVGLALAAKQQGSDRVAVVNFGDGATNTGSFHEGMNLASTWQLPVVFVCQNNLWAEMTPVGETMNIDQVVDRRLAYAMAGERVDGNDPEAVHRAVTAAVERARTGGGPTFIEAVTFRFEGHYFGDQQKYMPTDELQAAKDADPIPRYRQRLIDAGLLSDSDLTAIEQDATAQVDAALAEVLAAQAPDLAELDQDVFVNMEGIPS
ncbi:pyruvate dehydrogenase E1 component alpha subunit [Cryptosporangium aurantiacum]|uniref:Pyruvate dehydrogenase E1 component alpha subunit n=2 Tax=Cryptosporangium aurantiacum TaxID=134849 RepID=A0A1M7KFN4_9ACTN|nr:thiamine pyrophosphate-dependent dehydrogenase E1 component subunit alpha [Cryptosporangium aurantiacum]SHM64142.1 pyruvate dehydrogenase E1 component alpha subunit [Cryptosporangium aurantiacum]